MKKDEIIIRGAREHNLKNVSVRIPRNKLCVITGVSGSGKSSLAFDTIFAEGQRRYVESLSAYARQFLGRMEKPDVEYIEGLSPSISIDQKGVSRNPRSTVGTVTEIYDYLRLLFARIGVVHCFRCGKVVEKQTVQQIVDSIAKLEENSRRAIELSHIKEKPKEKPTSLPYRHLVTLAQSKNNKDQIVEALKRTGDIDNLDKDAIQNLDERIKCIKGWLEEYAPESVKFLIQKEAPTIEFSYEEIRKVKHLEDKMSSFDGFQVNEDLVSKADQNYLFMHCLPAHRGDEVTDGVIDSQNSVVFDQAENRMWAQMSLLTFLCNEAAWQTYWELR